MSSSQAVAFALREEYAGTVEQIVTDPESGAELERITVPAFTGGVIVIPNDLLEDDGYNVREALDAGDGTIVVDANDVMVIQALDGYPALKRVEVPDGATVTSTLDGLRVGDLKRQAELRGVELEGNVKRDELVTGLRAFDRARGAGELVDDHTYAINADGDLVDLTADADSAGTITTPEA